MHESLRNIVYLKIFLFVVLAVSVLSLSYRVVLSFVNSAFQYKTFNLLLIGESTHLIHLDREFNTMTIVKLSGGRGEFQGKSRLAHSMKVGLLVDGSIVSNSENEFENSNNLSYAQAFKLIFAGQDYRFDHMNWVDVLKVSFYSQRIDKDNIKSIKIDDFRTDPDTLSSDFTANRFIDADIYSEKQSVQIINATGLDGLASQASKALKNMGYNVVSLTNGKEKKSVIEASNIDSSSVKRLQKILVLPIVKSDRPMVSDITVVFGEELERELTD